MSLTTGNVVAHAQAAGAAGLPAAASAAAPSGLLAVCLVSVFVFPADMVIEPIGAVGYVGMLLAILLFATWAAGAAFGLHDPLSGKSPARLGLAAFWLASIAAYVLAAPEFATPLSGAAADRWLLYLLGMSGVILVVNQLTGLSEIARAVRALTVGGTICGLVAVYQFLTYTDPMDLVRSFMVGWYENGGQTPFQPRSQFVRVAGSTFHPIELGVVSSMILPLAVWRALCDGSIRRRWLAWVQAGLIAVAAIFTVSRSAILSILVVIVMFIPALPRVARRWAILVTPGAVIAIFMTLPGFVTTIVEAFGAGTRDPSLATRVSDYAKVEALVSRHPWTGIGPGAYLPADPLEILDNQYLGTAATMGLVGVLGLVLLLLLPMVAAIQVAATTRDPSIKCLAGGVAAALGVAALSSATFDSLSFPVFVIVLPAAIGLSGSVWNLSQHPETLGADRCDRPAKGTV